MHKTNSKTNFRLVLALFLSLIGCSDPVDIEMLPRPDQTLAGVGKRLSDGYSTAELTKIAADRSLLLRKLTSSERDALARGYLRFVIDQPAEITVAYPENHEPFWITDQGFTRSTTFSDADGNWQLAHKSFPAGWVGLGVNSLDSSTPNHYFVLLKTDSGQLNISRLDQDWQQIIWNHGQDRTELPIRNLPTTLRNSFILRPKNDISLGSLLAKGQVWKTHVVSGTRPDQVVVAFGADPKTELTMSWRTSPDVVTSGLRLRKAGDRSREETTYSSNSQIIIIPELLNDPTIRRHTVRVSNLEPNTVYEYAINQSTAWIPVRTAPASPQDHVKLLYMGDPQCGLEKWGKLLAVAAKQNPNASALLIAGDLVDRGNERTNWDHFFMRAEGVFERLPLMPAIGNHEYLDRGPYLYRANFALPDNGPREIASDLVYSYEIGDSFVAVLDSELGLKDPIARKIQGDWLSTRLAETKRTWKLVMYHHPVFASHVDRESPALREAWVPIFDNYHVDLVLQGHDHSYMRSYPLKNGEPVASASEGTIYLVSVSGDKYYEQNMRGKGVVGYTNLSTYQTIDIDPSQNRLSYHSYDITGRVVDRFSIEKGPAKTELAEIQGNLQR